MSASFWYHESCEWCGLVQLIKSDNFYTHVLMIHGIFQSQLLMWDGLSIQM